MHIEHQQEKKLEVLLGEISKELRLASFAALFVVVVVVVVVVVGVCVCVDRVAKAKVGPPGIGEVLQDDKEVPCTSWGQ